MPLPTKIVLEVVTPMGLLLREEVDEVIAPGEDGYFGVRPGHTPFLSTLGLGEISFRVGGQWVYLTCFWGFCEVLPDRVNILAELGERKGRGAGGPLLVGFAAETEDLLARAEAKLVAKNLDFIVANDVSRSDAGIEADLNEVTVLDGKGGRHVIPLQAKRGVAESILDRVFGTEAP